jgi:outer membrane immunogenic protein
MSLNKWIGIASIAAATVAATPSLAQPAKDYWSGFYAGLNAGGIWNTTSAGVGVSNGPGGGFAGGGGGFMGGAQAGYNFLLGPVLLGGEVDFQGSTLSSNLTGVVGPSIVNAQETMPWFSTMRARVGYPLGSVMPYLTGGAVWGRETLSGFDTVNGAFNASSNYWTYTFGAGMEGHLNDQWSAKLEWLWVGTPDTQLSTPASTSISERSIGDIVRVGLNYKF